MIQPNSDCIGFCNWMLNISKQRLSSPQRLIVNEVYAAALGNYPISAQTWYNFNLFTAWRNKFYLVYRDYASFVAPSLLTMLTNAYNFEGNSNDLVGSLNFADSNVTYNASFGKIGEGVNFNGVNSFLTGSAQSVVAGVSISFWFKPITGAATFFPVFGNNTGGSALFYNTATNALQFNAALYGVSIPNVLNNAWNHVVLTFDGNAFKVYLNGFLVVNDITTLASVVFLYIGYGGIGIYASMDLDMLYVYSKILSNDEVLLMYNGGAGIQYPF